MAAAEYLRAAHSDVPGFSPRNLRRMRDYYRAYEDAPEVMAEAMAIGWTQNAVILEAELSLQERMWYIRAVRQFGWSKLNGGADRLLHPPGDGSRLDGGSVLY